MTGCSVFVHTHQNDIYLCAAQIEQDHEPNLDLIQTTRLRQQMEERDLNELTSIGVIYGEDIMKASLNDSSSVRFLCNLINSNTFFAN